MANKTHPWQAHYPENIQWDVTIPEKPLYSILDEAAKTFPDHHMVDFFGKKYSYSDIALQVNKLARGLQKIGVIKGTRVALLLPNCPQYVVAYFAILKVGGIVVNCNPLYTLHELTQQIKSTGATYLVTLNLKKLFEKTSTLLQTTPLERVIVAEFQDVLPFPKNKLFSLLKKKEIAIVPYSTINVSYKKLIEESRQRYQPVQINPSEDIAVLQSTGGTTGEPKAAVLTHANLYANVVQAGMWFDGLEEGQEKMLAVLPFFHVFAMTGIMNLSIHKGCEIIMHPRLDVQAVLKDIDKKGITLLPGVPTLFASMNNFPTISNYDLTSVKYCISGGAPLPKAVKDTFEERSGSTIVEGYGLSECSPVACVTPLKGEHKEVSVGLPLPATIVEIRSHDGKNTKVAQGKVGEICISGPQVMKEYYGLAEQTSETLKSGRLHTGDLGYMDKEGYVFIVDRLKEMIIVSGFNVYPREIEDELYKHKSVDQVAVLGIDDADKGQAIKAFIVLKQDEDVSQDELLAFLKDKLATYKLPKEIVFKQELPLTLVGKIDKKALKSQAKESA